MNIFYCLAFIILFILPPVAYSNGDSSTIDGKEEIMNCGETNQIKVICPLQEIKLISTEMHEADSNSSESNFQIVSILSLIVAAISVIVAGIIQWRATEALKVKNLSSLKLERLKMQIDGIQEALADYLSLSYELKSAYKTAMDNGDNWPSKENYEKVLKENSNYYLLRMRLNPSHEKQNNLINKLEALRSYEGGDWIEKFNELSSLAQEVIEREWSEVIRA